MKENNTVHIYHNPRCSKSRQTLELLQAHDVQPVIIEYLANPPSKVILQQVLRALNFSARQLMRTNEAVYKDLKLNDSKLTEDDLIAAMVNNPILIERPIVTCGKKAAIGRPPETVLDTLP